MFLYIEADFFFLTSLRFVSIDYCYNDHAVFRNNNAKVEKKVACTFMQSNAETTL